MPRFDQQKFVCIDCEMTGLDPKEDRIIEVAAMCFDANQAYESMEALVDPECTIPEVSIAIHHITQDMVNGKPLIKDVLPDVLKVIGDRIIVGHGVKFDIEVLALAAEKYSIPCRIRQNRFFDTLRMARLYGDSPVNSLEQLRKHFNIPMEGAHRAMSDVIVNKEVFLQLAKRYKNTEHLFEALSKPILMATMPLGKHKGRPLKEVPLQYLHWMLHKEFDEDLTFTVKTELKRRKKGDQFQQAGNPFQNL